MKYKEVIELLQGSKIRVENKRNSAKLQKILLKLGFCWSDTFSTRVKHTNSKFLYVDNLFMIASDYKQFFNSHPFKELKIEDVFKIKITDVNTILKEGQDVLARNGWNGTWKKTKFVSLGGLLNLQFKTEDGIFEQCIEYYSNEDYEGKNVFPR